MNIIVAEYSGFCFGVKNAIEKTMDEANKQDNTVYTFGDLIHNNVTIRQLRKNNVKAVYDMDNLKKGDTVIIRAHGLPKETYNQLSDTGVKIIDATCPFVKKIHRLVEENYKNGKQIVIVGDKNHPEVIGINGWCENSAVIIKDIEELKKIINKLNDAIVVAQTTQNVNLYNNIKNFLQKKFENIDFYDTICNTTIRRQEEAKKISSKVDIMFVIGSNHSANSKQLHNICKEECADTFLVETADQIPHILNKKIKNIGITAGASTPDKVIKEVIGRMEELNKQGIESESENENNNDVNFKEALEDSLVTLRTGQIVKGKIISYNKHAQEVYVDLGFKIDGTVPFREFTDDRDFDPDSIEEGQEIEVLVIRVNDSEGSVLLSKRKVDRKKKWRFIERVYKNKETITVKVKEVIKGGLLARKDGQEVFIPASQVSDRFIRNLNKFVDKDLDIRIIEINRRRRKVVGSSRVLIEEEKARLEKQVWENIEVGKVYNGIVKSITNFGVFVDIGGIDGLVHISELSWKKIKHPSQIVNKGQEMEVRVLDFDRESKKISLGYKKEEDNPWYNAEEKFAVGKRITGKVVRIVPFGAFVEIEEGIDGLVHISQISNVRINKVEDVLSVGMEVETKIIDNDIKNKKISLSIKEVSPIDPPYAQDMINDDVNFSQDDRNNYRDSNNNNNNNKKKRSDRKNKFDRFGKPQNRSNQYNKSSRSRLNKKKIDKNVLDYKRQRNQRRSSNNNKNLKNMPESVQTHKEDFNNTLGDLMQGLDLDLSENSDDGNEDENKE